MWSVYRTTSTASPDVPRRGPDCRRQGLSLRCESARTDPLHWAVFPAPVMLRDEIRSGVRLFTGDCHDAITLMVRDRFHGGKEADVYGCRPSSDESLAKAEALGQVPEVDTTGRRTRWQIPAAERR